MPAIGIGIGIPFGRRGGGGQPSPSIIGTVFEDDWTEANWTESGASTAWTYNADSIDTVGTSGALTAFARYNQWTFQTEKWTLTGNVVVNSSTASDKFLSLGIAGVSELSQDTTFQCALWSESGANKGKTEIYYMGNNLVEDSGVARLTYSVGDVIEYLVDFLYDTITFSVRNLTTPSGTQTITYTIMGSLIFPGGELINLPNINQIAIFNNYGDYTISRIRFEDNQYKNGFLTVIGDSKSERYYCEAFANGFTNLLGWRTGKICQVSAGSGDMTQDILNCLPEVLLQAPQYVIMNLGSNDLRNGILQATWEANYESITTQLEAAGIQVWHMRPTPEGVLNLSALDTFITSTYTNVIDVPSDWDNATDLNPDAVHYTARGNLKLFDKILTYTPFIQTSYTPTLQSNVQTWYDSLTNKPTYTELNRVNLLFYGMETIDNVLTQFDLFHPIARLSHSEQMLRPIITTGGATFTAVNSPTFDSNGVNGNGTTSYVNTNWNPSTHGVNYTQNMAYIGVYNNTTRGEDTTSICGASDFSLFHIIRIYPRYTGGLYLAAANSVGDSVLANAITRGLLVIKRTASNALQGFRDTTSLSTDNDASAAIPNRNLWICGQNIDNALVDGTTDKVALVAAGGDVNVLKVADRVWFYMNGN